MASCSTRASSTSKGKQKAYLTAAMAIAFAFSMYYWREATPARLVKTAVSALLFALVVGGIGGWARRRHRARAVRSQVAEEEPASVALSRAVAPSTSSRISGDKPPPPRMLTMRLSEARTAPPDGRGASPRLVNADRST